MGSRRRAFDGGIASLVELIEEHGEAIEYDLLTKTNHTIGDVGGSLPWGAFLSFIKHLPPDSAFRRETMEGVEWLDGRMTAAILADIYDSQEALRFAYVTAHAKKGRKVKPPKPYPRPWRKDKTRKHFGRGAIPAADFDNWWNGGSWQTARKSRKRT